MFKICIKINYKYSNYILYKIIYIYNKIKNMRKQIISEEFKRSHRFPSDYMECVVRVYGGVGWG